jgi:hypothetical protein
MTIVYKAGYADKLKEYNRRRTVYAAALQQARVYSSGHSRLFFGFLLCDIKNTRNNDERLCIYCGEKDFVFVGDSARCAEILNELPQDDEPFHTLAEFFSELTSGDIEVLEKIENNINELELGLLTTEKR